MTNPESIDPQLFGVDEITQDMALEITKITRNPNALLMQTHHEDKYALAKTCVLSSKMKLKLILGRPSQHS